MNALRFMRAGRVALTGVLVVSATIVAAPAPALAAASVRDICPPVSGARARCLSQVVLAGPGSRQVAHPRVTRVLASQVRLGRWGTGSRRATAAAVAPATSPVAGTPAYLQQAYDLSWLSATQGSADTVAIVDAFDDATAESDLATYRSWFGLPPCTVASGCLRIVDQNGGTNYPTTDDWSTEISLDLDAVSALCPNCRIVLVEADDNSLTNLAAAQATANALGANQISDSWSGGGSASAAISFGPMTFAGVATVASSGDSGYEGFGVNEYPAALTDVTAAGGTTLTASPAGGARGFIESAWSYAGAGCDANVAKPTWQSDTGCTGRTYSDLSANGNPDTGLFVYSSADFGWITVGGTSESAPLIAAYYAITGVDGSTPAWAYANAGLLNDPAGGSIGLCSPLPAYVCNGGTGYDGPTGVGSISGAVVAGAPGIAGQASVSEAVAGSSATVTAGVYPNGLPTSISIQYGTTSAYGQQSDAVGVAAGAAPVLASVPLTGLAPLTSYHARLIASNADGTSVGYDFTFLTGPASSPVTTPPVTTSPSGPSGPRGPLGTPTHVRASWSPKRWLTVTAAAPRGARLMVRAGRRVFQTSRGRIHVRVAFPRTVTVWSQAATATGTRMSMPLHFRVTRTRR